MKERLGHQVINQEWGICVRTSGLVVFRCLRFAHCSAINLFNHKSGNKLHLHLYKIKNYKVTILQNCQINQPEVLCFTLVNLVVLKNGHYYGKTRTCTYLFKISSVTFKENHTKSTQFMGIMPMMSFHSFLVFQKDLLKLH